MGFKIPKYLEQYLNNTKYRLPFDSFVDNSTYYSQLDWQWQSYMQTVVRECLSYATGTTDGLYGTQLSTATGMAIVKGATRLIVGDRLFFLGDDDSSRFLSDIWAPYVNFDRVLSRSVLYALGAGTSLLKINIDSQGRSTLVPSRIDRTIFTMNENGEITDAVFFISALTKTKNDGDPNYWLVEERKYNDRGQKVVIYKAFVKGGMDILYRLLSQEANTINSVHKEIHKTLYGNE